MIKRALFIAFSLAVATVLVRHVSSRAPQGMQTETDGSIDSGTELAERDAGSADHARSPKGPAREREGHRRAGNAPAGKTNWSRPETGLPQVQETLDRASDLVNAGKPEDALAVLRDALAKDPGNAALRMHLGEFYLGVMQDPARAALELEKAYVARPDNLRAFNGLVDSLRDGGDINGAITHLREVAAQVPTSVEPRLALSDALMDAGRAREALDTLGPFSASRDPQVHERLAEAYGALGRHDQEAAAYQHAQELADPYLAKASGQGRRESAINGDKQHWGIGRVLALADDGKTNDALDALRALRDDTGLSDRTYDEIREKITRRTR